MTPALLSAGANQKHFSLRAEIQSLRLKNRKQEATLIKQQIKTQEIELSQQKATHRSQSIIEQYEIPKEFSSTPSAFFAAPDFTPSLVQKLLKHVVRSERNEMEDLSKKHPLLCLTKGTVTDLSGRTFVNISGFGYARWALDYWTWQRILPHIPKTHFTEALDQLTTLKISGTYGQKGETFLWKRI